MAAGVVKDCRNLRSAGSGNHFHAIYNLLIAYGGVAQYIAYFLPVLDFNSGEADYPPPCYRN